MLYRKVLNIKWKEDSTPLKHEDEFRKREKKEEYEDGEIIIKTEKKNRKGFNSCIITSAVCSSMFGTTDSGWI